MRLILFLVLTASAALPGCGGGGGGSDDGTPVVVAAEVAIGERLFRETRFAQFFAANFGTDVNASPAPTDPTLATTITPLGPLPAPVAGPTMSCHACHLHTEAVAYQLGGLRTFGDFAEKSPIPDRGDGFTHTARNSPPLVGASATRAGPFLLHFDGEFGSGEDLVRGTFLGRNFGWLVGELGQAQAHVARVVREDDGSGSLAQTTGGFSYAMLLRADARIPLALQLPPAFRIEVTTATNAAIVDAIAALVDAFMKSLDFERDAGGEYDRAPFDLFLERNGLPRRPDPGEFDLAWSRRLRAGVEALTAPVFVTEQDGSYSGLPNPFLVFVFGQAQLDGMKIFLAEPASSPPSPAQIAQGGIGNCIGCHAGPLFTDFLPHNVGASQAEYDAVHGDDSFLALAIPDLATRSSSPEIWLPASPAHPTALGVFRRAPDAAHPGYADLGVWNVLGNPDLPLVQGAVAAAMSIAYGLTPGSLNADALLPLAIGAFKTPVIRSPTFGGPYFHHGDATFLEDVSEHYRVFGAKARAGTMRNPDPEMVDVALVPENIVPLAAFLRSLNEDFQ